MAKHFHLMNGSSGCIPDSNDTYGRVRDAQSSAEYLFAECLCSPCAHQMSKALRTRGTATYGSTFHFNTRCEREAPMGGCFAGADYIEITPCSDSDGSDEE
ncbi:MAG: hypothetical protein KGI54_13200 [Pseudomonadota bacterium]|nr:hypothetical protein [Pseudomonadota bacterium]